MRVQPIIPGVSKFFVALLLVEMLVTVVFAWWSWLWLAWAKCGPTAFSGSPDAAYLYYSCESGAVWSGRALIGTWLVAASLLAIHPRLNSSRRAGPALGGTLIALPVLAWMVAYAVGATA